MSGFHPDQLLRQTPALAAAAALFLLVAGFASAFVSERDFRIQKIEQAEAHARVLAASVSAALAFQDVSEAQRAVDALAGNPDVQAIGVYGLDGALFAGRAGPPPNMRAAEPPMYAHNAATASEPVVQEGVPLGVVFVRLSAGAGMQRWLRYAGFALFLVMAGLIMVVIAATHRALSRANSELTSRAAELAAANENLSAEIVERRKAQSALVQAQKMEALGQLTGGVAHDFNNLLMVIASGLHLLETRDDRAKRASIVDAMRQAVDRGAGLTRQLLAFSRRQPLTPEVVVLQDRIENLRSLLERSLREDIAIDFDFAEPMSASMIDPGQFDLALLNLAVNARDAMSSGGRLTIGIAPHEDCVAVSVIDTGSGMAPDVLARAFDPFFTTKDVGQGTGLGLSQVYGFALQSGGRCEIESVQGSGTTVRLVLPRTNEPPPQRAKSVAQQASVGAGAVLVVEDDDNVAAMVCEMIHDLGYSAARVSNAQEALSRLEAGPAVDLMFSDIIMPGGLNGIELAQEVARRSPTLPILLTSGYGGRGEAEARGYKVLRKPYDRDELGAALASMVRRADI